MSEVAGAARASDRAQTILKAVIVDASVQRSRVQPVGEAADFSSAGVLEPPYDPASLCHILEHSNALRPNIDAYATNIDAFGHRLEPAIDLEAEDADQRIADCIYIERLAAQVEGELAAKEALTPTAEEVAERRRQLEGLARVERARLDAFFDSCGGEHSFVELRRRTRQDREVTGNAYWEVLRTAKGDAAHFVYVPSHTVRLLPLDPTPVSVAGRIRISPVAYEPVSIKRQLRRFVQVNGAEYVYFKTFGDPRVVSRKTGAVFKDVEALRRSDETDGPATELIHFRIHSPRSPYGVPRWIGGLLSVLGSREQEETNYLYFGNKSVPPLAILVSGGRLSADSVPRLERYVEENLKGQKNFHKILILEADGDGPGADATRAKVELKPLTSAQQQDELFQQYDERNIDKVGSSFRLPRMLRGDSRDFNRAVADAALRFAEDQVFQPERDEFDHFMNHTILADLGIRFWRFKSQTPITRDPERLAVMVEKLVRVGVLTPEEGRLVASDVFNRELRKIGDDWTKRPITLTLAGIQTGAQDVRDAAQKSELLTDARRLLNLRDELAAEESRMMDRRAELARRYLEQPERGALPAEEAAPRLADSES